MKPSPVKVVVFAHTPPPYHGQSYMVQLMLDGLGGDHRLLPSTKKKNSSSDGSASPSHYPPLTCGGETRAIQCFHVNSRLSNQLENIGEFKILKVVLLCRYALEAIWCRFYYGAKVFYYVPAPGKRAPLYRDWMVMALCRWAFRRTVFHWHAAGLGGWLEREGTFFSKAVTRRLLGRPDLSLVLSNFNEKDIGAFRSKKIAVVNNGIPDPCPHFHPSVFNRRGQRLEERKRLLTQQDSGVFEERDRSSAQKVIEILFLAHCTEEKGLFDTIEGVFHANDLLRAANLPVEVHLTIAGHFVSAGEKNRYDKISGTPLGERYLRYRGFVSGKEKTALLDTADIFCFPTFYPNENQPVNLIEAMAFGLPILSTRWRSIPELFPPGYRGIVDLSSPRQIGETLLDLAKNESGIGFRQVFLNHFTLDRYLHGVSTHLQEIAFPVTPRLPLKASRSSFYQSPRPRKILQVFNDYLKPGGEANSVARIASDLESAGHGVHRFWRSSQEWQSVEAPLMLIQPLLMWRNGKVLKDLLNLHTLVRPDFWLLHNVVPVISMGVYALAKKLNVPIIQWLHNYRPISPSGTLYAGTEKLHPADPWIYWKETLAGSWNGKISTAWLSCCYWRMKQQKAFSSVRAWVTVSEGMRNTFRDAGWSDQELFVLRHSWNVENIPTENKDTGHFLFLGRMVEIKGVRFLIDLWKEPAFRNLTLIMAGTGPLADELAGRSPPNIRWVGHLEGEEKKVLLRTCRAVLFPAIWSEPLSTVVYEAYENRKPVVASAVGGMKEVVVDRQTGRLLPPNDATRWRDAILELARNQKLAEDWGSQGRDWLQKNVSSALWNAGFDEIVKTAINRGPSEQG